MAQPIESTTGPNVAELVISRLFGAPRPLVFKAWTEPAMMARWWGPSLFTNPVCELDVRPGGAIRIDMRAPDGTIYPMTGEYREVVEPERLVYTSAALDGEGNPIFEVLTTVTFAEHDGGTMLTMAANILTATAAAPQYIAGMEEGWTQSLARLEALVAEAGAPGAR